MQYQMRKAMRALRGILRLLVGENCQNYFNLPFYVIMWKTSSVSEGGIQLPECDLFGKKKKFDSDRAS
jgi:hypothetical protein